VADNQPKLLCELNYIKTLLFLYPAFHGQKLGIDGGILLGIEGQIGAYMMNGAIVP
jgi:hypothetical protein